MKRVLALMIAVVMIFSVTCIAISAKNISFNGGEITQDDHDVGDISSISYSDKDKKININGTVAHDTMVSRNEGKIEVYRIPIGESAAEIISDGDPVISADISVKFHFSIKAESVADRLSAYVVVIKSKSGDWTTIGEPLYASVDTDYSEPSDDRADYKGISTELTSNATAADVGSAIIPVSFDELLSHSSTGYIYSLHGTHLYFDKPYISSLDLKIKSYVAIGARVYLQFTFDVDGHSGVEALPVTDGESPVPDMSNEENLTLISAFTDFICDRYPDLSGIILGQRVDDAYDADSSVTAREYAENYAQYMLAVANVARSTISTLDIVLPLGDTNSYSSADGESGDGLTGAALLSDVSDFLDYSHVGRFAYSTMIETSSVPYGISEATLKNGAFAPESYSGVNADSAYVFSDYITSLQSEYDSAPLGFIFKWTPNENITGNVLAVAYSYSYFKLMALNGIMSFVVSFEQLEGAGEYGAQDEISNIMKYIDTDLCFDITEPQLKALRANSWYSIIPNMYSGEFDIRQILKTHRYDALPDEIIGSFVYYDFMYYTDLSLWSAGNFCDSLKIDHSKSIGRSLGAHFTPNLRTPSEYSEFFCDYDYPENYVFTPYVSMIFSIDEDEVNAPVSKETEDDEPTTKKSLYEVKITMGSDDTVSELSVICKAGEEQEIVFDMAEFSDASMVEYIKISVRSLSNTDAPRGYTFSLASILGHSTEYTAGELSSLISSERQRIRNLYDDDAENEYLSKNSWMIMLGAALTVGVIGVGVFMCFRREDDHTDAPTDDTED